MRIYAVYGASGFGREVMPLIRDEFKGQGSEFYFIDDAPSSLQINGYPVLSYKEFIDKGAEVKSVCVAIANSSIREHLFEKLNRDAIDILDVKASNVVIMDEVAIDSGFVLSPFVTLTSNVKVGAGFHANIYSYVGHDCIIGNYVTFAPSVKCNGNVHIGDHAYIGTGAIIKQGRTDKPLLIGAGAIVGMGAVVTKDVPPGVVVVGNPAKPMTKEGLRK